MQKAYIEYVKYCDFKIGDKVEIIAKAKKGQGGWLDIWYPAMDKYIGLRGEIFHICITGSISVIFGNNTNWDFPAFVLEKVEDDEYNMIDIDGQKFPKETIMQALKEKFGKLGNI